MKYLKQFIIGSSAFVTMPWMWSYSSLREIEHKVNYDYYDFSLYLQSRNKTLINND